MATHGGDSSRLFSGVLSEREEHISRFEDAWSAGLRPEIDDFLPASDPALQEKVLSELVLVDLEWRLKSGEAARAEDYLGKYPQLALDRQFVVELLLHELQIRRQQETVSLDEYASRFPQYIDAVRARLSHHPTTKWQHGQTDAIKCPHCSTPFRTDVLPANGRLSCPHCNEAFEWLTSDAAERLSANSNHLGRFELLELAGKGAFGTVWRARDTELDRLVAIKVPNSGRFTGPEEEERFLREARSMAQLRHPCVVAVYESGQFEGLPFIVAEFIHGKPLSDAIAERRFSAKEAAELMRRVAGALDYAHQHGVVHRDLKPSNIMLDNQPAPGSSRDLARLAAPVALDYEPRVMDFGMALRDSGEATVTVDGQIVGTAAYMSPEQARGESHHVDRRSDVYSAGVILYELLAGETPFRGNLRMVLQQVLHDEPRPIRRFNDRVPRDLETICLKCLEKEPRGRYESAGVLADELERFLTDRPIVARPVGRAERIWRWCRRHPTIASLTATIVAVIAIGFAGVTWQWLATKRAEQGRTLAQVDALLGAAPEAVPTLLASLAPYRAEVDPVLRRKLSDGGIDDGEKLRARLSLLAGDSTQAEPLFEALFKADMETFLLIRHELMSCPVSFDDRLASILVDDEMKPDKRFRAACYLAVSPHASQQGLAEHAEFVVDQLIAAVLENPSDFAMLQEALMPMADRLVTPLSKVFGDTREPESARRVATNILADFVGKDSGVLIKLVLDAEPWQLPILMPVIANRHRGVGVEHFQEFLQSPKPEDQTTESLDWRAKQQANAAIALVELGAADSSWPILGESNDMSARSYFIDRYAKAGCKIPAVIEQLKSQNDSSIRRALYLILGGFPKAEVDSTQLAAVKQVLLTDFTTDADPGIHAAARWLLERWGFQAEIDQQERGLASRSADTVAGKRWYVNSERHTLIVHGPATFLLGSPLDEEGRHQEERLRENCRIDRKFAIAMCETTIEQYRRFDPNWHPLDSDRGEDVECPVYFVSWNQAAAYCNWLSQREEIPQDQWCYLPEPGKEGLFRRADDCLALDGYRLPTEEEWEYVCRAGTTTARFFGHTAELLPNFAWCPANSPMGQKHPVGLKMPNDMGLFDVYGNADEFCHDVVRDTVSGIAENVVITRGGAAGDLEPPRSAMRNLAFNDPGNPTQGGLAMGFRVARTIDAQPDSPPGQ